MGSSSLHKQKMFPAGLVTFTEEILNEKLHILYREGTVTFNLKLSES